ncbi:nuclear transport factor 2 family protein [Sphingobium lactosutens]|uniref:nuclear transport factor 2 family protein n=1 Tax=Sphingobium lactosutens TaxID=522773 RepID=UPI0015B97391|nr:nuclear transport factor 2 family protein [Sphingobium lactosutens]
MPDRDALDILLAKQACTELVYTLARGLDRCDRGMLLSVFHPDATDDHGGFKGSAAEFVDWVVELLPTMERTQHLIGNVLIDVAGDHAVGEACFMANHDMKNAQGQPIRMIAAGRYLDRFERREGLWKIAHRHAVYDWNANLDRTDTWDRSPGSPRVFGERGTGDPLYAHRASLT